jgi:hypothetical protein
MTKRGLISIFSLCCVFHYVNKPEMRRFGTVYFDKAARTKQQRSVAVLYANAVSQAVVTQLM